MAESQTDPQTRQTVEAVYRTESRRVFATLIRLLGDFDLAEEALHDAFTSAMEQWPRDGVPDNPRAWLVTAGRVKAVGAHRPPGPLRATPRGLPQRLDAPIPTHSASPPESVQDHRPP